MAPHSRLVIVRGPGTDDPRRFMHLIDTLLDAGAELGLVTRDFHPDAPGDDPVAGPRFDAALEALRRSQTVVLAGRAFDDPQRRARVEQAFRHELPDLVVEHVEVVAETAHPAGPTTHPSGGAADPRPGIVIDDDVYGLSPHYSSYETISVTADAPRKVLVRALTRAGRRMMSVGEDGLEYADVEKAYMQDIYTPNWVADVEVDDRGAAGFYIDCKGAIETPMAEKFKQILAEELVRAGIERAHVRAK